MRKLLGSLNKISILKQGIIGFISFFIIILGAKAIHNLFSDTHIFNIDFRDIATSSLGFLLVIILKMVEKFSNTSKI